MRQLKTWGLTLGLILFATACKNSSHIEEQVSRKPLSEFDWKTTVQVPVNITSSEKDQTAIFIYSGNSLVAAGYTPFNETVTVPSTTTSLQVTTFPKNTSSTKAYNGDWIWPIGQVVEVPLAGGGSVTVSGLIDLHADVFVKWAGWKLTGNNWNSFVSYWNAGGTQTSSIILLADKEPYSSNDGSLEVEHLCLWPQCNHGAPEIGISTTQGTYLFEDLFSHMGDYDMNDVVIEEVVTSKVGLNNKVKEAEILCTVKAVGGSRDIALALFLPKARKADVENIEITKVDLSGGESPYACSNISGLFSLKGNMEISNTDEVVIPLFDNVRNLLTQTSTGSFFNTLLEGGKCDPLILKIKITFSASSAIPVDQLTDLFIMPHDSKSEESLQQWRGREVHLVDARPTNKMDQSLWGSGNLIPQGAPRYTTFRSKDGYVWALYLPVVPFGYPLENTESNPNNIFSAYPLFRSWIESAGVSQTNWYNSPEVSRIWK